jgi:hypothetical protein
MNVPRAAEFFDISSEKRVAVSCNASGKMATPSPVGARDTVFMRVAGRFPTGLNSQRHEKMTTIITLSQTCGLHAGIQQVMEGRFPRFCERGPIEA